MDFNYVQRNWDDGTIESLRDEVISMTGIDSDFEDFKKYKLIEYDAKEIDPVTKSKPGYNDAVGISVCKLIIEWSRTPFLFVNIELVD